MTPPTLPESSSTPTATWHSEPSTPTAGRVSRRSTSRRTATRSCTGHPILLFDGGDIEEGSVRLSGLSKGVAGWRLLGAAGVDAAVVGNGGLLRYGVDVLDYLRDGYAPRRLAGQAPLSSISASSVCRAVAAIAGLVST